MGQIRSEQEAQLLFRKLVEKQIDQIMRQYANNIRVGRIIAYSINTNEADVEIYGTGELLKSIKYQKGVSMQIFKGDVALVVSADPRTLRQNYIVGIF